MGKPITPTAGRKDMWYVDPRELVINLAENSRMFPPSDEAIVERAYSMMENGQLQPIMVRKANDGYHVVLGFTRALAGMKIVNDLQPCEVGKGFQLKCVLTDANVQEAYVRSLDENLERNQTSPMDDAFNHRKLREELGWDEDRIAKKFKCSVSWLGQMKKLLTLASDVQAKVHDGLLTVTRAIELADLSEEEQKEELAKATSPVADERKANKISPVKGGGTKIDNAKLSLSVRKKRAANGKCVGRTRKEIYQLFEGLTGPGEHEAVRHFAEVMLEYMGDLKVTERKVTNALEKLVNAVVSRA
jgi:ParB/RepB/Spo0J family partition protein